MDNNGNILAVFFEKRADLILILDIDIFVATVFNKSSRFQAVLAASSQNDFRMSLSIPTT